MTHKTTARSSGKKPSTALSLRILALVALVGVALGLAAFAGELDPPVGPPAPTMHSLEEIFDLLTSIDSRIGSPAPTGQVGAAGGSADIGSEVFLLGPGLTMDTETPGGTDAIRILGFSNFVTTPGGTASPIAGDNPRGSSHFLNLSLENKPAAAELLGELVRGKRLADLTFETFSSERIAMRTALAGVRVEALTFSGAEFDVPVYSLALSFETIRWTFFNYDDQGNPAGEFRAGYDVENGRPL
jgi:hypothetical protein